MHKKSDRYLIVCKGCQKHIIGSQDHCQICPNCYRPNPLWRKLTAKEHHSLKVDMTLV